jgi:hypothetical protein
MSRNLEDKKILHQVKTVSKAFAAIGLRVPPTAEAATQAYLEATQHPGSEIRVTCTGDDEVRVMEVLMRIDERRCEINWSKTSEFTGTLDADPKHLMSVCFNNESRIDLRMK